VNKVNTDASLKITSLTDIILLSCWIFLLTST